MIYINIGYECGDGIHCDKYKECKYKVKWYRFNNVSDKIHIFFEYRLHIKLPYILYIGQKWERLSGTDKCPFHKSRDYGCYDCEYMGNVVDGTCVCDERNNTPYKEQPIVKTEWGERCGYFKKCKWADDYKTK